MMKEKCKSRVTEWIAAGHALADWTNLELLGEMSRLSGELVDFVWIANGLTQVTLMALQHRPAKHAKRAYCSIIHCLSISENVNA